jgi:hypothetical protein
VALIGGASAAMAVVVLLFRWVTPSGGAGAWLNLLVGAPVGLVVYVAAGTALGVEGVQDGVASVRRRFARR